MEPDPRLLHISVTLAVEQAEPGQTVRYDIRVTDALSQPVAAQLSLDLVDKAILTLMPRTPNAVVTAFYDRRYLGVSTASGMALLAERLLQPLEEEQTVVNETFDAVDHGLTTGGEAESAPMPTQQAPLTDVPSAAKGEAGRGAASDGATVREEFADTAYWNGFVETDAGGNASVEIPLPDNLTTWVMRGVGITPDTQVGEGTSDLIATKPVLIRPVTPRFFVVGDTVELAANVSNRTDESLEAQVSLATTGLTVTTELTQTIQVPANGEAKVTWQVVVQDAETTDLIFRVSAGEYQDASRPRLATAPGGTIPIYRYSAPEVVGTGGRLSEAGARTEVLILPPNVDTHSGELTVRLDPSLAASMPGSLTYLEHFEYECTEQTVSRFLPNIVTVQALKRLGISNPELEDRLPGLVEEGLGKLYARQHYDGGWGWWTDDESQPSISAYVVFGLLKAKEAGFTVREEVLAQGVEYLKGVAAAEPELTTTWQTNQQAWLLYVLAQAGTTDEQLFADVFENRDNLSAYASAFLAMALHQANPDDPRIKTLLSDLNNAAIISATGTHWEEDEYDWWNMNTDTRSTAIILSALVQLDAENVLNPNVVRWLMVARNGDAWETTQETAWSILALTDWMAYTGELHPDYDYAVWLGDSSNNDTTPRTEGHIGNEDVSTPVILRVEVADLLRDTGNWLTIGRGDGSGQLYYTAHLRTFLPVEDIEPLNRGIIVQRRYTLASCTDGPDCPTVESVKLGDIIRVEISIVAPNDLYYVVVEDPLPAGAEAIDPGLATTSQVAEMPAITYDAQDEWNWWWWWRWYSHSEFRDEKVVLFADYLSSGTYLYSYTMRATLPGEYHVIPTTASEFYFPEVYGRGAGQVVQVTAQ